LEPERGLYALLESGRIFRLPIAEGFIGYPSELFDLNGCRFTAVHLPN
jgi:hypothetical protein